MKRSNEIMKIAAVFLIAGLFFAACTLNEAGEYGTLVVVLPGGASHRTARAAGSETAVSEAPVSEKFAAALTYQLDCRGSGRQLIEQIPAGGTAAVALLPGDWEITVTVLNAAGESIGSGSAAALINSGETTTIQMPIAIDTGGNDIASFLITSPADAVGTINTNTNTITVLVPQETNTSQMTFTAVHTGRSISPESGTKVNFTTPKSFTVIAENSLTKSYMVTVIPSLPPSMTDWPSDATWQVYGLGGLTQPGGTVVRGAVDLPSGLVVTLGSADQNAFDSLIEQIEESLSQRGLKTSTPIGSTYSLSYRYNGKGHSLTLVFSMGMLVMEL